MNQFNINDRVKRIKVSVGSSPFLDLVGTIMALETELGPEYVSVKWDGNTTGFYAQVPKECLIKVD